MKKKLLSLILVAALLITMLTMGVVSTSASTGTLGVYTPGENVITQRLYFAMPACWMNDETAQNDNCAGIYWWQGYDRPDDAAGVSGWPGYKTVKYNEQGVENLWYSDVPAFGNGDEGDAFNIVWNNYVRSSGNARQAADKGAQYYCRYDDVEKYDELFRYVYMRQAAICGLDVSNLDLDSVTFWENLNMLAAAANGVDWDSLTRGQRSYQIDNFFEVNYQSLDFSEFGSYASNFFNDDTVDLLYPDEEPSGVSLSFTFDNMVYVVDLDDVSSYGVYNGEFYFYYGNGEYGVYPTKSLNTQMGGELGNFTTGSYYDGGSEPEQPTEPATEPENTCDHDWSYEIYPADCGHTGMTHFTCSLCGETYDYNVIERSGEHNYVDGYCTVCGLPDPQCLEEFVPGEEKEIDPSESTEYFFRFTPSANGEIRVWSSEDIGHAYVRIYRASDFGVLGEDESDYALDASTAVWKNEEIVIEVGNLDPANDPFTVEMSYDYDEDPGPEPQEPLPAPEWEQRADGKIYLYVDPSLELSQNDFTIYFYEHGGDALYPWGAATGNMIYEGDNVWSYDPSANGVYLDGSKQYGVIFTKGWNLQSTDLIFSTECLGDMAFFTGFGSENPVDSSKESGVVHWVNMDRESYAPPVSVTSSGRIIGNAFWAGDTAQSVFSDLLDLLNDGTVLNYRDAQEVIDEAIIVLHLTLDEAEALIEDSGYTFHWSRDHSFVNPDPYVPGKDKTIPFEYTTDYLINNFGDAQMNSLLKIKRIVTDLLLEKEETEQAVVDRGFEPGEEEDLLALLEDVFKTIGDLNGDDSVTIEDATLIQRFLAEYTNDDGSPLLDVNSELVQFLGDLNRDGRISVKDVTELQRFLAEFIKEFPLESHTQIVPSGFAWPCPGNYFISTNYGEDRGIYHSNGIEIAAASGSTVVAADGGTVVAVYSGCTHNFGKSSDCGCGGSGGFGNYVFIDHGNGKMTIYAHLLSVSVEEDQQVSQGQVIGFSGATGYITGPALYFECRYNGVRYDPMTEFPM